MGNGGGVLESSVVLEAEADAGLLADGVICYKYEHIQTLYILVQM